MERITNKLYLNSDDGSFSIRDTAHLEEIKTVYAACNFSFPEELLETSIYQCMMHFQKKCLASVKAKWGEESVPARLLHGLISVALYTTRRKLQSLDGLSKEEKNAYLVQTTVQIFQKTIQDPYFGIHESLDDLLVPFDDLSVFGLTGRVGASKEHNCFDVAFANLQDPLCLHFFGRSSDFLEIWWRSHEVLTAMGYKKVISDFQEGDLVVYSGREQDQTVHRTHHFGILLHNGLVLSKNGYPGNCLIHEIDAIPYLIDDLTVHIYRRPSLRDKIVKKIEQFRLARDPISYWELARKTCSKLLIKRMTRIADLPSPIRLYLKQVKTEIKFAFQTDDISSLSLEEMQDKVSLILKTHIKGNL